MKCSEFQQSLSLFLDGRLDASGQEAFLQHQDDCASCRKMLAQSQAVDTAIAGIPMEGKFVPAFRKQEDDSEKKPAISLFQRYRPAFAGALCLLVIACLMFVSKYHHPGGTQPTSAPSVAVQPSPEVTVVRQDVALDDTTYNITVTGEEAELLYMRISEGSDKSVILDYFETR